MDIAELQNNIDIIWIIISAALVMFMQAGFTALESGLTRAKNSINVAMKNLLDFILAVLIFWLFGYGLMFGDSAGGFFGTSLFALNGMTEAKDYAIFAFQVTFAGTAVTIVSGAVAERMRFSAYAIIAIAIIAIIYPVSGHWIWANDGWLAQKDFVDFAGSTVVHSIGGWIGLAGALVLGARMGRFDEDGKPTKIHGQNLVLAVVGVLILWFGWFGFNGGSTLSGDASIALIITNTMLAASAGGISCFLTSLFFHQGTVSIEKMLNGIVAGLVAITAGCNVVGPNAAIVIGLFAGVLVDLAVLYIDKLKIDDPVGAIAVHGVNGLFGALAVGLFATDGGLFFGGGVAMLGTQALGVLVIGSFSFVVTFVIMKIMQKTFGIRITKQEESAGIDAVSFGVEAYSTFE